VNYTLTACVLVVTNVANFTWNHSEDAVRMQSACGEAYSEHAVRMQSACGEDAVSKQ
jgi:hypothetical protein